MSSLTYLIVAYAVTALCLGVYTFAVRRRRVQLTGGRTIAPSVRDAGLSE